MNINWDEVAEDADSTPASLLAEVLGRADEVKDVIILIVDQEGIHRRWLMADEGDMIAMLELAKFVILQEAAGRT